MRALLSCEETTLDLNEGWGRLAEKMMGIAECGKHVRTGIGTDRWGRRLSIKMSLSL